MEKATFAGGCFWCIEAIFQRLKGVNSVLLGYSGGEVENPTYEQVCSGTIGHVEAMRTGAEIPEGVVRTETKWSIDAKPIPRPQPSVG